MTQKPTIYEAVAAAIGEVQQLGKSEKNKFDGYDFVSIDKFLKMVNPICFNHGLFPMPPQIDVEYYKNINKRGEESTWARFVFEIVLMHKSGESLPPTRMVIPIAVTGAQCSGSAQSYALKQYFRSLFMIPTGDKDDPDFSATEPHSSTEALADAWKDGIMDKLPEDATAEQIAKAFADAIAAEVKAKKSERGLDGLWNKRAQYIKNLENKFPDMWAELIDVFENHRNDLQEKTE